MAVSILKNSGLYILHLNLCLFKQLKSVELLIYKKIEDNFGISHFGVVAGNKILICTSLSYFWYIYSFITSLTMKLRHKYSLNSKLQIFHTCQNKYHGCKINKFD